MSDYIIWPARTLVPDTTQINIVPFSRSSGRSLNGLSRSVRTDRGWWSVTLENIILHTVDHRRIWNALRQHIGGRAGLVVVPAWSFDTAPYAPEDAGMRGQAAAHVPHSDGVGFSDGSLYQQSRISVRTAAAAQIGDTQIWLELINGAEDLSGVRFSHAHALYETGPAIETSGNIWRLPISVPIRREIPAGDDLEFDNPTCLCRLADERGMDVSLSHVEIDRVSVSFVEASDYWSNLAAGLI